MRPAWGVKKILSWWVITVMSVDIFVEWRLGSSRENVIVLATMSWHIVVKCLNHCVVIMQRLVKLILSTSWHHSLKQETKNNSPRKKRVLHFQINFLADDVDFAPEAANFRYSRYTWSEVYSLNVKKCTDFQNKYVTFPSFSK